MNGEASVTCLPHPTVRPSPPKKCGASWPCQSGAVARFSLDAVDVPVEHKMQTQRRSIHAEFSMLGKAFHTGPTFGTKFSQLVKRLPGRAHYPSPKVRMMESCLKKSK